MEGEAGAKRERRNRGLHKHMGIDISVHAYAMPDPRSASSARRGSCRCASDAPHARERTERWRDRAYAIANGIGLARLANDGSGDGTVGSQNCAFTFMRAESLDALDAACVYEIAKLATALKIAATRRVRADPRAGEPSSASRRRGDAAVSLSHVRRCAISTASCVLAVDVWDWEEEEVRDPPPRGGADADAAASRDAKPRPAGKLRHCCASAFAGCSALQAANGCALDLGRQDRPARKPAPRPSTDPGPRGQQQQQLWRDAPPPPVDDKMRCFCDDLARIERMPLVARFRPPRGTATSVRIAIAIEVRRCWCAEASPGWWWSSSRAPPSAVPPARLASVSSDSSAARGDDWSTVAAAAAPRDRGVAAAVAPATGAKAQRSGCMHLTLSRACSADVSFSWLVCDDPQCGKAFLIDETARELYRDVGDARAVRADCAATIEREATVCLLASRKLALVVDLDETLVHSETVDIADARGRPLAGGLCGLARMYGDGSRAVPADERARVANFSGGCACAVLGTTERDAATGRMRIAAYDVDAEGRISARRCADAECGSGDSGPSRRGGRSDGACACGRICAREATRALDAAVAVAVREARERERRALAEKRGGRGCAIASEPSAGGGGAAAGDPDDSRALLVTLRDGATEFLERASRSYQPCVFSLGSRAYVEAVLDAIDPRCSVPRHLRISRDDLALVESATAKHLLPTFGSRELCVVLDDRIDVWKSVARNVCAVRKFGGTPDAELRRISDILDDIHSRYFSGQWLPLPPQHASRQQQQQQQHEDVLERAMRRAAGDSPRPTSSSTPPLPPQSPRPRVPLPAIGTETRRPRDVVEVMAEMRRAVLANVRACIIAYPLGRAKRARWYAVGLGAECVESIDAATHVVCDASAIDLIADDREASENARGKIVVAFEWVERCYETWQRQPEPRPRS